MTFSHSGHIGDVIYSIPTIAAMGGGELRIWKALPWDDSTPTTVARHANGGPGQRVMRMLERCSFGAVTRAGDPADGTEDVQLDKFHEHADKEEGVGMNLADMHLVTQGLPRCNPALPWLDRNVVGPIHASDVVFARSPRYRSGTFPWTSAFRKYGERAVFVGLCEEHRDFCENIGKVDWYPTDDLWHLARVIAGCRLFVGNQSSPLALAEGMKVSLVQETSPKKPNCVFKRRGEWHNITAASQLPELENV